MTVKQLRAFLAVAQSLSFVQACARLHLSQPALSLTIKNLEESLGGPLLVRTTRSVSLAPEGELLLPIARHLLADWDNTEELLRQHFTLQLGKVAIAAMPSFAGNLLAVALKAFRTQHPKVHVAVHDFINEHVLEMLRSRRVELGSVAERELYHLATPVCGAPATGGKHRCPHGKLRVAFESHQLVTVGRISDVLLHVTDWNSLNLPPVGPPPDES